MQIVMNEEKERLQKALDLEEEAHYKTQNWLQQVQTQLRELTN